MSFVNPSDSHRQHYLSKYGLENHPAIQAKAASDTALEAENLQLAKELAIATMTNTQKAEADLKKTLTDFLKQPHQDNAEKS
jgi:hypothetical protein